MRTHTVTVKGLEARVIIERGNSTGYPAQGTAWDEDGGMVAATTSTTYNGYCTAELVAMIADELLVTRRQIESEDVWAAVEESGLHCTCDIEDED